MIENFSSQKNACCCIISTLLLHHNSGSELGSFGFALSVLLRTFGSS
jgi:hypothetical protein